MKFIIKTTVKLMTRFLYKLSDSCHAWDTKLNITNYPKAYEEILFWRDNIDELNVTNIDANDLHYNFEVHSDASNNAVGVMVGNGMSCHKTSAKESV